MASTAKEKHIANLRAAGYLAADIAHRLPDDGKVTPTPGPHERVVFLAHFVCGLGFPLHPFVRGLMFYYGLDFHDLAPNFVLNTQCSSSYARLSSASSLISACGCKPST